MLRSKLSDETFESIISCYAREVSSGQAAIVTGVSSKTIKSLYQVFSNCLFAARLSNEGDRYLHLCMTDFIRTGVSSIDPLKHCALFCPAITDRATNARRNCHVCPNDYFGELSPASWNGPGRAIFLNRKFLAALEGYHLLARLNYFIVVDALLKDDEKHRRAPGTGLSEKLKEFLEGSPIDMQVFDQSWKGGVNRYFQSKYILRGGIAHLRPRSSFRRQE
jgi:hypothetical protein